MMIMTMTMTGFLEALVLEASVFLASLGFRVRRTLRVSLLRIHLEWIRWHGLSGAERRVAAAAGLPLSGGMECNLMDVL